MSAGIFHDTPVHFGSPDLVAYRPSLVELDLAGRVIDEPHDLDRCGELLAVAQSPDRAEALIVCAAAMRAGVGE